jgi:hypothetical protein
MPAGTPPKWGTIVWTGLLALAALSLIIAVSGGGDRSSSPPSNLSAREPTHHADYDAQVRANLDSIGSDNNHADINWQYNSQTDALGHRTLSACTESSNSISLHWPYGETKAVLCVQTRSGRRYWYVHTEQKSQMLCSSYEGCSIPVRYDSDPAGSTTFYEPSDYDSSYLLARGVPKKLPASKQMVVAPTFYQDGEQEFVFDTHGLDLGKIGYAPHFELAKHHRNSLP